MIITLAGYNVEKEILDNLEGASPEILTPEIFSSAYARISRSANDITTLRKKAREDVEKARKSNSMIIFKMGHHSVAEHAVFNFDVIGVSRLALEELEQFRLVSYTEKSQRYVTLDGDYVVPAEITDPESRRLFQDTVLLQNEFYQKSFEILKEYLFKKHPEMLEKRSDKKTVEGWAKEDARYILSLATEGQVGMTINARNLEHLFRRFRLSNRHEVQEIGRRMHQQVMEIAPSIILFSDPSDYSRDLAGTFGDNFDELADASPIGLNRDVQLVSYSENADDVILASFLAVYKGMNYPEALSRVKGLDYSRKEGLYRELLKRAEFFDSMPRQFEMVDIVFQAVVSASNFAQLKRHRMATLLQGNYETGYGNTVPENIRVNGLEEEFLEIVDKTNGVYLKLKERYGDAADYILTNSHCRMVMMKMNLREMFHFARLRSDDHAQWDIRNLSDKLLEMIKPLMPLSTMLLCGKSDYVSLFEKTFDRKPQFLI